MFGLSITEIMVIAILALVVFGPDRIPGIARTIGKTLRDMRKAASDVQRAFEVEEIRRELKAKNTAQPPAAAKSALPSSASATTPSAGAPAPQAAGASASAPLPAAPELPQLRAPIQSVPALSTFSALRDAVDAPDPLNDLAGDDDAQAEAEDAALAARLKDYLRSFVVVSVPLVAREPLRGGSVFAVALSPRGPHMPPFVVSVPSVGAAA